MKFWQEDDLKQCFDIILSAFDPERIMFGSDWPVCLQGVHYLSWLAMVERWIEPLSETEQRKIMGENAVDFYELNLIGDGS